MDYSKVHIFREGHKFLLIICSNSQVCGGDSTKFCGLLRIYELYLWMESEELKIKGTLEPWYDTDRLPFFL